ncbi:MAG: TolB family protein [Chloroflexia bacterium]
MLREELWVDLASEALTAKIGPNYEHLGYLWVDHLIPSPDSQYLALVLGGEFGHGVITLILGQGDDIYIPTIPPSGPRVRDVGLFAWMPSSNEILIGDSDGNPWGIVQREKPHSTLLQIDPRIPILDAVALPDGKRVLLSREPQDDIWIGSIEITSGRLTPFSLPESLLALLKGGGYIRNLALSPDGSRCAFTAEHSVTDQGGGQIWLAESDGTDFRALGPDNTYDYDLAWSPDGQTIAFVRWDPYPGVPFPPAKPATLVGSLWLIDVAGGKERLLLSSEGKFAHWDPEWLPDGSGLVFLSDRGGEANLYFIRSDGTGLQQLTRQGGLTGEIAVLKPQEGGK